MIPRRTFAPAGWALLSVLLSCGRDSATPTSTPNTAGKTDTTTTVVTPPPPPPSGSVARTTRNSAQAATVGSAFTYDVTRGGTCFTESLGASLSYVVKFSPSVIGLTATAGKISGTPSSTGQTVVTITASNAAGAAAADTFDLITFAAGLTSPVLNSSFQYTDASGNVPSHFTTGNGGPGGLVSANDNTPANNPVTNTGAALGRTLFYDKRLSGNDAVACASCHQQSSGFADTARLSKGFKGGLTGRHSMALTNTRYYSRGRMFWDERASSLEDQVLRPIQDTVEMGMTFDLLEKKLALTSYYPALFNSAFGSTTIIRDKISLALAQFVRSLVSGRSKFDQGATQGPLGPPGPPGQAPTGFAAVFTAEEENGRNLFASTGCAGCHSTFIQLASDVRNTGLDATITDVGAGSGKFKVPSLRNAAVRGRFMHDGRFTTLAEVVEFYNSGVRDNGGLDNRLRGPGGQPQRLKLTAADKSALVAFLGTLTDPTFLSDTRFGNPFP